MTDGDASPRIPERVLPAREGYDKWSALYDEENNPLVALEEPAVDRLMGEVRDLEIVDLGCGTGRHALRLAGAGARVTAVDFSEGMLGRARAKPGADRIRFLCHDLARPLPLPDASFDRVVSGLVLEHIPVPADLMAEVARLLRPGGFAVISAMHPAMMLRGVQARFVDPTTRERILPRSFPHQISDFVMAALEAGLTLHRIEEHSVDEALVARSPRAAPYLGWPMLLVMKLLAAVENRRRSG